MTRILSNFIFLLLRNHGDLNWARKSDEQAQQALKSEVGVCIALARGVDTVLTDLQVGPAPTLTDLLALPSGRLERGSVHWPWLAMCTQGDRHVLIALPEAGPPEVEQWVGTRLRGSLVRLV
jgi:hypothetical protein